MSISLSPIRNADEIAVGNTYKTIHVNADGKMESKELTVESITAE